MLRLLAISAALTAGLYALIAPLERRMVYPFDATQISPAEAGEPRLREIALPFDGQTLILWAAAPKPGQPTLLYFHGNAGNLANRLGRFRHFLDRGYGLIAPAYRGSSGSSGKPNEPALTADALHIYQSASHLIPGQNPAHLMIYGESLGAALALTLAAQNPAAMILEAPFTSLPEVAAHLYPPLAPLTRHMHNQWPSLAKAQTLTMPLLILHGTDDTLIPIEMGRQIHSAAPSRDKTMLAVPGAGHTDLWRSDTLPRLWRFISDYSVNIR